MQVVLVTLAVLFLGSSVQVNPGADAASPETDALQVLDVYLEYSMGNVLDTFSGTDTKDLVCHSDTTIAFFLTDAERDTILELAEAVGFFAFPDTLHRQKYLHMSPDPSPDVLRLKAGNRDHTVTCLYPLDPESEHNEPIRRLRKMIREIIENRDEYKALPRRYGSYE